MQNQDVIRKLQKAELMVLKDVAMICEDNGLKYYLIGGTLLGAIRHQGFIPWDDDIDIVMFRDDYDKLFDIMNRDYRDKYFVQRFETDPNYSRYIMKIRLNGTKHVENRVSDVAMNHGIYIDIFPIDYLKNAGLVTHIRGGVLRALFAYKNVKHSQNRYTGIKRIASYPVLLLTKIIPEKIINKWFDDVCVVDNKKNCSYVTNFASHFKWKKQMYPREYFDDGVYLNFEGTQFKAPKEYIKILERLYGDYMKLPPENKRVAHNIVEVDFGPYSDL